MAKARYRARAPGAAAPPPPSRRSRWLKRGAWLVVTVLYAAVMWYWVFPYVDRTFVNQPAVGEEEEIGPVPTQTFEPAPSDL